MQKKFFFGVLIFFLSASLFSHQRSESYSKVNIENEENHKKATIEFSIQTSVLQRLNLNFTQDWEKEFTEEVINNFKHEDINGFKKILYEMIETDNKKTIQHLNE